jgi:trehalose synthase
VGQYRFVREVELAGSGRLEEFLSLLSTGAAQRFREAAEQARERLSGRVVWNVSSTATGGGVAEMLHSLLVYVTAAGVDGRWLVIEADSEFFAVTKRLHNAIHGSGTVAEVPAAAERPHYEQVNAANLGPILERVSAGDIVVVHDPQPAGLIPGLRAAGAKVVWRSHIGRDTPTPVDTAAWDFLRPYAEGADAFVFSRRAYAPAWVPADRLTVIPPSIDPLSTKNRPLGTDEVVRLLLDEGVLDGAGQVRPGVVSGGPAPGPEDRLVVQVSRWDRLKDMAGVMTGFAAIADVPQAHLMLVGPAVAGVTDDPEGAEVFAECLRQWGTLPDEVGARVHLVQVPMDDPDHNALVVNAVQRHAAVVTQKSLVEGFGLTVAEAMWKSRPVVASAVGGIADQIADGKDGLLLPDPHDLAYFGGLLGKVLGDADLAARLGAAAHARVHEQFLGDRHLMQYADLLDRLVS